MYEKSHSMDMELNNNVPKEGEEAAPVPEKKSRTPEWLKMLIKWRILLIFGTCSLGFVYQFKEALDQYWAYKTTSAFTNENPANFSYKYPSTTLCFVPQLPYYKVAERFPEYKANVKRLQEQIRIRNDENFAHQEESRAFVNITGQNFTGGEMMRYFNAKLVETEPILSLLENFSFQEQLSCYLISPPSNTSLGIQWHDDCAKVTKIVESIGVSLRCYTFFSQLDLASDERDKFTTSFLDVGSAYAIKLLKNDSQRLHPFETNLNGFIATHSHNMLPTPGSYPFNFLVKYGISAGFNFQKTITELLPAPYQTNCFNYELGNTMVDQSFEECVTMCGITKWRKKCNCLPPKKLLYRKTHLLPDDKFCPAGDPCTVVHVRSVCSDQCKPDCLQERYQVEKVLEAPIQNYYVYDNTSIEAMIARKPVPDEIFRHSAAKTFIDIVSEFGGLVGLWLGYSVITLAEIIYALLRRPSKRIQKRISKKRNAKQLSKSPIPS